MIKKNTYEKFFTLTLNIFLATGLFWASTNIIEGVSTEAQQKKLAKNTIQKFENSINQNKKIWINDNDNTVVLQDKNIIVIKTDIKEQTWQGYCKTNKAEYWIKLNTQEATEENKYLGKDVENIGDFCENAGKFGIVETTIPLAYTIIGVIYAFVFYSFLWFIAKEIKKNSEYKIDSKNLFGIALKIMDTNIINAAIDLKNSLFVKGKQT